MEPTLSKGDLILVRAAQRLEVGQIVVYQSDSVLIVHRIVSLRGDTVVTQGDANPSEDAPIDRTRVKGVVCLHIPYLGTLFQTLKTPAGTVVTLLLAFALVELSFRRQKQADDHDLDQVKAEIRRLKEELDSRKE